MHPATKGKSVDIDLDKLIEAVRELAAENPDFVYRRPENLGPCRYDADAWGKGVEEHGCIIGRALARIGCHPEGSWTQYLGGCRTLFQRHFGLSRSEPPAADVERRIVWLEIVQRSQDNRVRWGSAVARADLEWPLP